MKYKERYTIGEVSRICHISTKALRYYDRIGLISSKRDYNNNYRYFNRETLLAIPVIKYYKQMGFTLDEMRANIEGNTYNCIKRSFETKIDELEIAREEIRRKHISVKDWRDLISEAELVIDNDIREVSVKYVELSSLLFLDQTFENDIRDAIINIEFTNYVEKIDNEITGPVIIQYTSREDRAAENPQPVKILQRPILPLEEKRTFKFGGQMMASCYHIGPHETIFSTYDKIGRWARRFNYRLAENAYERYVTDYWTTEDQSRYVTEVMVGISRR